MAAKFFGLFLLENGLLTSDQLLRAVDEPRTPEVSLSIRGIDAGLVSADEAAMLDELAASTNSPWEELAVEKGLLTEAQVTELRSTPIQDRLHLGTALIEEGILTKKALGEQLSAFHQEAKEISGIIAELYHGLPSAAVLEAITGVTVRMFQRMLHAFVKPSSLRINPPRYTPCAYIIQQELKGDFTGIVCLNISAEMLKIVAGRLLAMEVEDIDADALDGAGEFINVISGNVCGLLSNTGIHVEIGPPTVSVCKNGALDLGDGFLTITALAHPDEHIEVCILDTTSQA